METIQIGSRIPEQLEYWGGFFGEALRPNITREMRSPRKTARNPVARTYYKPILHVFDRRRESLEYIKQNFGGAIREQPQRVSPQDENPWRSLRDDGFYWELSKTNPIFLILTELQPYMISQEELIKVMIDFLIAKQQRVEEYRGSHVHMREEADDREAEEAEFSSRLIKARNNPHHVRLSLSPANIAGVLDASSAISISRAQRVRGYVEYGASVEIHSDNNSILETISKPYSGLIYPVRYANPVVYSEKRFYCSIGRSENIQRLLETTLPYLNLQRRQAEVALKFLDIQQTLTGGSAIEDRRHRRGDMAETLQRYSSPELDLITILREGFYSEIHRLNN